MLLLLLLLLPLLLVLLLLRLLLLAVAAAAAATTTTTTTTTTTSVATTTTTTTTCTTAVATTTTSRRCCCCCYYYYYYYYCCYYYYYYYEQCWARMSPMYLVNNNDGLSRRDSVLKTQLQQDEGSVARVLEVTDCHGGVRHRITSQWRDVVKQRALLQGAVTVTLLPSGAEILQHFTPHLRLSSHVHTSTIYSRTPLTLPERWLSGSAWPFG